jgi:hypothetical protein
MCFKFAEVFHGGHLQNPSKSNPSKSNPSLYQDARNRINEQLSLHKPVAVFEGLSVVAAGDELGYMISPYGMGEPLMEKFPFAKANVSAA